MDVVLGLLFWGGLLALTLVWIARTGLTGNRTHRPPRSHDPQQPPRPTSTSAWSATAPPGHTPPARHDPRRPMAEEQRLREDEALADGLIIGHFLTRDHYRREIDDLQGHLDDATEQQQRWAQAAATGDEDDDEDDYAEFDAIGGFGVEPWADDLFDHDDED